MRTKRVEAVAASTRWGRRLLAGCAAAIGAGLLAGCVTGDTGATPGGLSALVVPTGATAAATPASSGDAAAVTAALADLLGSDPAALGPKSAVALAFYQRRDFEPAWTGTGGWTDRGAQVHAVLRTAWVDGLTDRIAPDAPPRGAPLTPAAAARHDAALTAALAAYIDTALERRPDWAPKVADGALGALVAIAADAPEAEPPGRLFRLFAEDDRQARLRRGILRYAALTEAGGWPAVTAEGDKLEPGDTHPDVVALRARLKVTGDLPADAGAPADPQAMDPALVAAVKRFQGRHGLAVDGKVGPRTRAALAMPAEARLRQMALNLRRLRELPPDPGGRSIEVNIAGAALEGREDGVTTFRTDVIVGMRDRPTPRLRSAINRLVLNPTWTVPTSIAGKDILPKLLKDPQYLTRNNFQVFEGWTSDAAELDPATIDWTSDDVNIRRLRLRQAPGAGNALGEIKFMFPNEHGVYLHSTPSRGLFARSNRTFSSGCVRVRDPLDLATFLLNDPATWTPQTLKARIAAGGARAVRPQQSVPLSMVYLTAWVDADGTTQFRSDVYGHDAREMETVARAF